jgi:hypothetical protein
MFETERSRMRRGKARACHSLWKGSASLCVKVAGKEEGGEGQQSLSCTTVLTDFVELF